jgi:hypothetical protein
MQKCTKFKRFFRKMPKTSRSYGHFRQIPSFSSMRRGFRKSGSPTEVLPLNAASANMSNSSQGWITRST